jgi:hypothetical protein
MHPQGRVGVSSGHVKVPNVTLLLKQLGYGQLQLGVGHQNGIMSGVDSIANPGQHISYGVSNRHFLSAPPCYQLALRTPGNSPFKASSRKQMRQMPKYRM